MDKKRVLIFPAGAENALEIFDALRFNVNIELFGMSSKKDFAEYCYDSEHYIEGNYNITSPSIIEDLENVIKQYRIDVIIPTHDDVALFMAEHNDEFSAKILVSDYKTAYICRYKRKMYEAFDDCSFCPKTYSDIKMINEDEYPLFLKPNKAAGAVGTLMISSPKELKEEYFGGDYVLCEYLPGEELTVDCYTDKNGRLLFSGARIRDRVVMGIAFRSTKVQITQEIESISKTLNDRLAFKGAWYFQIKKDKYGCYKLLEISCRQAGTMTLFRHIGVNFPLLGIFELFDTDVSFVANDCDIQVERRLKSVFKSNIDFSRVYIDFDDTIIIGGNVCLKVIEFLYDCHNRGKSIVLLTRHDEEIKIALNRYCICEKVFDDIIQITFDDEKVEFINPNNSIFVDNSYAERKKVSDKYGIPVFDVDNLDLLLKE